MAPTPTADELWGTHLMPPSLIVDVLMPNGLLIEVLCNRDSTLESIKNDLWVEAKKNIFYRLLNESNSYIFIAVTQDSKLEEFYDESRRLCDLRLFQPILKLIEPEGNKDEKILNSEISLAIGRPVHELDSIKNIEVIEFRKNIQTLCRQIVEKRESLPIAQKVYYTYPPELDDTMTSDILLNTSLKVNVWVTFADGSNQSNELEVPQNYLCAQLIFDALKLIYQNSNNLSPEEQQKLGNQNKFNYFLKICGFQQYLLGNHQLFKYKVCFRSFTSN
jgi:phosphatidylinositol-4,5-bisphosphate 3-kinase